MSRLRRYSFSSFCFSNTEPNPDGTPAQKNARFSLRAKERTKEPTNLKVKVAPKAKPAQQEPPSEYALRLAKMDSLPPISPQGLQFAADARQGKITYADVAGEGFSRFLDDGLPGYEEVVGEEKADMVRRNIEMLRRGDLEELHDILIPASNIFYTSDKWTYGEKYGASRYPTAICTFEEIAGQVVDITMGSLSDSPTEVSKARTSWPGASWTPEKKVHFSDTGDESSICLRPSGTGDDKLQSSSYDSDEEQDDSVLGHKQIEILDDIPVPFKPFTIIDNL